MINSGDAGAHAARIREYLLAGSAQQRNGTHRGAVAGTIYTGGEAQYVYGEITGYYLHWLASLPPESIRSGAPAQHAMSAITWLEQYLRGSEFPLTRIYLRDAVDDWRNEALFAFDLAMIAGGLALVRRSRLAPVSSSLIADLQRWLQRFVRDDGLAVCLSRTSHATLPQRWSTSGGAFTAKTASRILLLGQELTLDETLLVACRQLLQNTAQKAERHGIDMVHPTLYALEGCLLSPDADLEKLATWFGQITALMDNAGTLPESAQTPHIRRTDIIAQALRVAVFLESLLQQPGRYRDVSRNLARALIGRIRADGSLPFSADGKPEANVWSAMFAEQALRLHAAQMAGEPLPFVADALV